MINFNFRDMAAALISIHKSMGYKVFIKYLRVIVLLVVAISSKDILKLCTGVITEIKDEQHCERMIKRDQYMTELEPLLIELRAEVDADRVLYFEFHNSEENLDRTPFKFFDLMIGNSRYGVSEVPGSAYKNIGASMYTSTFNAIKRGAPLYCSGENDHLFRQKFRGIYEILNGTDGCGQFVIFSVHGIHQPIGFIILEWMEEGEIIPVRENVYPVINKLAPSISTLAINAASPK